MNPIDEIKKLIVSGKKLINAQVLWANHLALPVEALLRFENESILFRVDSNDDTIVVALIDGDIASENMTPDVRLNQFVGCRLKSFDLIQNRQGYSDSARIQFLEDSGHSWQIRFVAGASQLEVIVEPES